MKAGIAMALGMTLLVPTFNAINNSYIQVTEVPPWMPPPETLPEGLRPPENPPTPPPDWTPPEGYEPPPGWEDWEPPEDWEGKFEGQPPPGWDSGSCPPPVMRTIEEATRTFNMQSWRGERIAFEVPEYTLGIGVWMNVTDWQAQGIRASIDSPGTMPDWGRERSENGGGSVAGIGAGRTTVPETEWNWTYDPRDHDDELPEQGPYALDMTVETGVNPQTRGQWQVETKVVVACGGALA